MRLRASLPLPDGSWKQRRISTVFPYPSGVDQARQLAEELGRDLELHRRGLETFPFERWVQATQLVGPSPEGISGVEALRRTETWRTQQRKRGPSADVTSISLPSAVQESQRNSNATYSRKSNEDHYSPHPTSRNSNASRPTENSQAVSQS